MFGGEDLEDAILKQKVPGRYSTWERGDTEPERAWTGDADVLDEGRSFNHEDEDEEPAENEIFDPRFSHGQPSGPGPRTGPQTGVKGVLNAAYDQYLLEQEQRKLEQQEREFTLSRIATGSTRPLASAPEDPLVEASDSDEDFMDDDDEFMREYKAKRLQQLQIEATEKSFTNAIRKKQSDRFGDETKVFGYLKEIEVMDLPDEVDKEDSSTFVVVHLYEPFIRSCDLLSRALQSLAAKYQAVKFLNLKASASGNKIDKVALPILNIYKAGKILVCLTRISDMVGREDFSCSDIQCLLASNGVTCIDLT